MVVCAVRWQCVYLCPPHRQRGCSWVHLLIQRANPVYNVAKFVRRAEGISDIDGVSIAIMPIESNKARSSLMLQPVFDNVKGALIVDAVCCCEGGGMALVAGGPRVHHDIRPANLHGALRNA